MKLGVWNGYILKILNLASIVRDALIALQTTHSEFNSWQNFSYPKYEFENSNLLDPKNLKKFP